MIRLAAVPSLVFALALPVSAQSDSFDLSSVSAGYVARQDATKVVMPARPSAVTARAGAGDKPPKDDLKPLVARHLDSMIAYCYDNMGDCNGPDGSIREFAKGIGGGRCNNRGFNCVWEVLEMCRDQLAEKDITPMYYMACSAMLGKLGERDCAQGRGSCPGHMQGALYFSLRAAAACHKSYEASPANQAVAARNMERLGALVGQNVRGVYVSGVGEAHSMGHHFAWHAAKEGAMIGTEKVLEFAFERLAMHGAGAAVSAAGTPLLIFSSFMFIHEIAAAQMHDQVCLEWSHSYKGSYANAAGSITRMAARIR